VKDYQCHKLCPAEMANLLNSSLLLHQPSLPQRHRVASGRFTGCIDTEIGFLQSRKTWRKCDGASFKARRNLHCKAQAQDGGVSQRTGRNPKKTGLNQSEVQLDAASNTGTQTAAVGATPFPAQPSPTYIGSPLLWIGVGVGISALFSWVANSVKRYAMQQVFKTMMGQAAPGTSQPGGMPMPPGSGFPFPPFSTPETSQPGGMPMPRGSGFPFPPFPTLETPSSSTPTVDVPATKPTTEFTEVNGALETKVEPKKPAFVDVSPEEVLDQKSYVEAPQDSTEKNVPKDSEVETQADGGATGKSSNFTGTADPILSVDALEKMMEDPVVQKMVYPYLPQEMQNPTTFKWMLQNPQYRKQLEEMLNNMSGDDAWDNRMMESFKNFDLSSNEVKQQFEQIGLTPEEVVSKIMANPDVAMAFQNPKVQAAIMDCSQNPMSITKYQNDKEVMDVFNKISELFPGMTGSP